MTKYWPKEGTVVVSVDGRVCAWSDGEMSGDAEIRRFAEFASDLGEEVELEHAAVWKADLSTAHGALAAMSFFSPGRTTIVQCPDYVRSSLMTAHTLTMEDLSAMDPEDAAGSASAATAERLVKGAREVSL